MTRAKFSCGFKSADVIYLSPVYTGSEENAEFFRMTPGGQIILNVVNPEAAAQFEVGQEYYVDFTKAPK